MGESEINILVLLLGSVGIIIAVFYYNSRPDLHNCHSCGKYLTIKAQRYWYKVNGENVPFCAKCNRKQK